MFLHTKKITAKRTSPCNAYKCASKVQKGEVCMHTVHTYKSKTISAVWHLECHKRATAYAPYWDRLIAIREGKDILPLPLDCYCPKTGKVIK